MLIWLLFVISWNKPANDFKFFIIIISAVKYCLTKIQQLEIWPLNCWWLQGNRNDMEWLLLCVWVMFDESFYHLSFLFNSISLSLSSISAGVSLYFLYFFVDVFCYFFLLFEAGWKLWNCICTLVVHLFFRFLHLLMDPIATEINISRNVRKKYERWDWYFFLFMEW